MAESPQPSPALSYFEHEIAATCPVCRAAQDALCIGPNGRPTPKTHYARLAKSADVMVWRLLDTRKTG